MQSFLPSLEPVRFVAEDGTPAKPPPGYHEPDDALLRQASGTWCSGGGSTPRPRL